MAQRRLMGGFGLTLALAVVFSLAVQSLARPTCLDLSNAGVNNVGDKCRSGGCNTTHCFIECSDFEINLLPNPDIVLQMRHGGNPNAAPLVSVGPFSLSTTQRNSLNSDLQAAATLSGVISDKEYDFTIKYTSLKISNQNEEIKVWTVNFKIGFSKDSSAACTPGRQAFIMLTPIAGDGECWADDFINPTINDKESHCNAGTVGGDSTPQPSPKPLEPANAALTPDYLNYDSAKGIPSTLTASRNADLTAPAPTSYEVKLVSVEKNTANGDIMDCPSGFVLSKPDGSGVFTVGSTITVSAGADAALSVDLDYVCPGYKYIIDVKACNDAGCSAASTVIKLIDPVAPSAVTSITATAGTFSYPAGTPGTVAYTFSAYDGGAAPVKYKITLGRPTSEIACPLNALTPKTPFTAVTATTATNTTESSSVTTDLCPGNTYTFTVVACNDANLERCSAPESASVTIDPVAPVCGVPTTSSTSGNGYYAGMSTKNAVGINANDALVAEDPMFSDESLSAMGFKTAMVFWPAIQYSGGAAIDENGGTWRAVLRRYIAGNNGMSLLKYQELSYSGGLDAANARILQDLQPSKCYSYNVTLCNAAGLCCTPDTAAAGDQSESWFQPSNSPKVDYKEFLACSAFKTGSGTILKSIFAGAAQSGSFAAAAGEAATGAASAGSSTSGSILAVAIGVPAGVAALAAVAVAATLLVLRSRSPAPVAAANPVNLVIPDAPMRPKAAPRAPSFVVSSLSELASATRGFQSASRTGLLAPNQAAEAELTPVRDLSPGRGRGELRVDDLAATRTPSPISF